jgi:hypothetical protein
VIRAGVVAGASLGAGTTVAGAEKEKPVSWFDFLLPEQLKKEEIQAAKDGTFSKLEFAASVFWVKIVDWLGDGVPHALIGIYAPDKDDVFHRCLFAESWAAGKIEARVDQESGLLELRERANSELKGQLVLACNLRTVGTQHSIRGK